MKYLLIVISLSLLSSGCIAQANTIHKYTGYEIGHKFEVLQKFITDYEVENDGPVLDNEVSIYKVNNNKCVIVSKVDGDSGGFGGEDILYFHDSKFLSGYSVDYSYTFLDSEGTKKSKKPNYMDFTDSNENTKLLRNAFIKYLDKFNKNTLNKCS